MQVDFIQAKDITFKKWQWWSDWVDICVFSFGYTTYLLQMSVSRSNAKKFKTIEIKCGHLSDIKSLTQMKGEVRDE